MDIMPRVQFNSLMERIRYHKNRFPNLIETALHSKFNSTGCPGTKFPYARILDELSNEHVFEETIRKLANTGMINSPEYWLKNAVRGGLAKGEYVRTLISRLVSKG